MTDDLLDDEGDLAVGDDQELGTATEATEAGQAAAIALRTILESYFIDLGFGTDWLGEVLLKPYDQPRAYREIRRVLSAVKEVKSVLEIDLVPNEQNMQLEGTVRIDTNFGEITVSV